MSEQRYAWQPVEDNQGIELDINTSLTPKGNKLVLDDGYEVHVITLPDGYTLCKRTPVTPVEAIRELYNYAAYYGYTPSSEGSQAIEAWLNAQPRKELP